MNLRQFLAVVEIRTKVVSLFTFAMGTSLAYYTSGSLNWKLVLLMGAAVLCIDMGTTGCNSFFDYMHGTDRKESNREKDKVLVHEAVPPLEALLVSCSLFLIAAILGIWIAALTTWNIIIVGGICILVGIGYTAGPLPISHTPFGELAAGGFLGSVLLLLSFYVQTGKIELDVSIASLSFFFMIAAILTVNNTCDRESDSDAGRKTLSILLGKRLSSGLILCEVIASWGITIYCSLVKILPLTNLYCLLFILPFTVGMLINMYRRGFSLSTKGRSMKSISAIFSLFALSQLCGLFLAVLIR